MNRSFRAFSLSEPSPTFDLVRHRKNPVVLFLLSALFTLTVGLSTQELLAPPARVSSLFVVDVSESALHSGDQGQWLGHMCDRYYAQLNPKDLASFIWFADQARIIGAPQEITSQGIAQALLGQTCNLPPTPAVLAQHQLGKQPGTALTQAVQLAQAESQQLRSRHPNRPIVVIIVLHQFEPGPTESANIATLAEAVRDLAQEVDGIRLIGPQGEIATTLGKLLHPLEATDFCPLNSPHQDIEICFQDVFARVRAATVDRSPY